MMVELEQPRFICRLSTTVISSLAEAERLKEAGNESFKRAAYHQAADFYQQALKVAPSNSTKRAVYYGNKAACHMHLSQFNAAVDTCTHALHINTKYTKVLLRRSAAYERLEEYQKALEDAQQVMETDPDHNEAKKSIKRLEEKLSKRDEAVKEDMIGKLKDLGNTVLGRFGVSLDDFKTEQDPETGNYSVSFKK